MLSHDSLTRVLSALAFGDDDRAKGVVATSEGIDENERAILGRALVVGEDWSTQARRFGDALRSIGAERSLVSECYRVAFYGGEDWKALSSNPLFSFFTANRAGYPLDKWIHYFSIYERHLARYRGLPVRVVEIGVYRGGGLEMLRHYLGPEAYIVGIDNDEAARTAVGLRYPIELGDQADSVFLQRVSERHGPFDIVIDDGGHTMSQQIASVETLFPLLTESGTYLVEDCHTSYCQAYSDNGPDGETFIEWIKHRIDDLNAYHHSQSEELTSPWQTDLDGLHIYDSFAVLSKGRHVPPFSELTGAKELIHLELTTGALNLELLGARDAAMARLAQAEAAMAGAASQADAAMAEAERVHAQATADAEQSRLQVQGQVSELVALRDEVLELSADLERIRREYSQSCSDLMGSWGIIREMRQSKSWKITAPIRRIKSLRGGR